MDGTAVSFDTASAARSLGDGTFTAVLRAEWAIGSHPHGGFLLALLAKAAIAALHERGEPHAEPLVVSAEFLHAPALGPVLLRTDVRKVGRRATVVEVRLEQRGRSCVEARVTTGRLPMRRPEWTDVPSMPAEPSPGALAMAESREGPFNLAKGCEVRLAPATAGYFPFAPPPGFVHHYDFDLYALDTKLSLDTNATRDQIEGAMAGHVVGKAVLQTRFKR